jgi:hypothetical protein
MLKKIKSMYSIPRVLAAAIALAIIISCGSGEPIDVTDGFIKNGVDDALQMLDLDSVIPKSSSSEEYSSFEESSSSIEEESSSSEEESSSSEEEPSSSSAIRFELSCEVVNPAMEWDGLPIKDSDLLPVVVTCAEIETGDIERLDGINDVIWANKDAFWYSLKAGTYKETEVEVNEEESSCHGLKAVCGTFQICDGACPSSSSTASSSSIEEESSSSGEEESSSSESSSSSVPVTITCTLPTTMTTGATVSAATQRGYLTCSNGNVPFATSTPTWTGTPSAPIANNRVAAAGSYNNIGVTTNCGTAGTGANAISVSGTCNSVTIVAASSSSSNPGTSSPSVIPSSSSSNPGTSSPSVTPSSSSNPGTSSPSGCTDLTLNQETDNEWKTVSGCVNIKCDKGNWGQTSDVACKLSSTPQNSCNISDYAVSITIGTNNTNLELKDCWNAIRKTIGVKCNGTDQTTVTVQAGKTIVCKGNEQAD